MTPKMGRPLVGTEPKNKQVALRVTETTVRKFSECAELSGKTKTALFEEMVDDLHKQLKKE